MRREDGNGRVLGDRQRQGLYEGAAEVAATGSGDAKDREAKEEGSGQSKPDHRKMVSISTGKSVLYLGIRSSLAAIYK